MFKKSVILTLMLCCPVLLAQSTDWNQRIQQLSFTTTSHDYRLGPGDLIQVDVFGIENFKQSLRINASGTITMPYLGPVKAAGLTTMELEEDLRSMLDGRYIKNPQVSVFVTEYRSQSVFVLGAVQKPGQYQITQPIRLIDAIGLAGGLNLQQAEEYVIIQKRGNQPQGGNVVQTSAAAPAQTVASPAATGGVRISLKDLLENGRPDLNVPVEGGDVIQVPERQIERFYVIGDVGQPGAFEIPRDAAVNVTQGLAWAGGPLRTAKKSKGMLVRYDEKGQRQEMALNVDDILTGKRPDVQLRNNDVIVVPGSTMKNIGYGFLGILPGAVSNSVIWGAIRR